MDATARTNVLDTVFASGYDMFGEPSGADAPWAATAETHTAAVFFAGDRAFKVKKPVVFDFVDFHTRAAREEACQRELELNRRLSPDVYLGIGELADGFSPAEPLVVMRRLPASRRLATLASAGAELDDEIAHLAHVLAAFHSRAERSDRIDAAATRDAVRSRWVANIDGLASVAGSRVAAEVTDRLLADASRYLDGRAQLFDARIADGCACDGHGDLLADDIFCLVDGPRILDCLEFDDRLRFGDVLEDVCFLAMDLERLGRPDLARRFLLSYREHSGDWWPDSLVHLYVAYRASVRAKVAYARGRQGHATAVVDAPQLLTLAQAHLDAGAVRLVLVGGLPGTGKSTVADALADRLSCVVLRSDEIRKDLAGLAHDRAARAAYGAGIYTPVMTDLTYGELLQRARTALSFGETVVLDASWSTEQWRVEARRIAAETSSTIVELSCAAPRELTATRLRSRATKDAHSSDASPAVADEMATRVESWPQAFSVDTSTSVHDAVAAAAALVAP